MDGIIGSMTDDVFGFPKDLRGWDWDSGEPQEEYEKLLAAYVAARKEWDEAIAHRDDYETMAIQQSIKIRELQKELDGVRPPCA